MLCTGIAISDHSTTLAFAGREGIDAAYIVVVASTRTPAALAAADRLRAELVGVAVPVVASLYAHTLHAGASLIDLDTGAAIGLIVNPQKEFQQ